MIDAQLCKDFSELAQMFVALGAGLIALSLGFIIGIIFCRAMEKK